MFFCCGKSSAHCSDGALFFQTFCGVLTIAEIVVAAVWTAAIVVAAITTAVIAARAIASAIVVAIAAAVALVLPITAAAVTLPLLLWAFVAIGARGLYAFKRVAVFVGQRLFVACAAALLWLCLLLAVRTLLAILPLWRTVARLCWAAVCC
ncbi:MAG: hypothetical protein R3E61_04880 [Pseudomonadales bacterium]